MSFFHGQAPAGQIMCDSGETVTEDPPETLCKRQKKPLIARVNMLVSDEEIYQWGMLFQARR